MKIYKILTIAGPLLILTSLSPQMLRAELENPVFICHKGNHVSGEDVKRSYKAQLDVPHVVDNASMKPQLMKYLGMDEVQFNKMWKRFYFRRALNLPVQKRDDAETLEFVARVQDSIGVVASVPKNSDVEVCGE